MDSSSSSSKSISLNLSCDAENGTLRHGDNLTLTCTIQLDGAIETAEVDEQLIMSRTGHSSTDGVRAYKRTSEKLKKMTSDVLNNSKKRTFG